MICTNNNGREVCREVLSLCDGYRDCDDGSDEFALNCPNCSLQWRDNADQFVEFTSIEDRFGRVNTTMWVLPTAFRCAQTLNDLKNISIFVSNEVQEKSEADGEHVIEITEENKNETNTEVPANKIETKTKVSSNETPNDRDDSPKKRKIG